jgi:uncharacterized protein (DUF608 family)
LDRGVAGSTKDDSLKYIGMPVGGIGCGQLYLGGDGKLWLWDIFKSNYRREPPSKQGFLVSSFVLGGHYAHPIAQGQPYSNSNGADVSQGFLIRTPAGTRTLDMQGFPDIQFRGEYPIGKVMYSEKGYPVTVQLEAFSPFIPLNAKDSAIPATVMSYTVSNTSDAPVDVDLGGWLQNATCPYTTDAALGQRRNSLVEEGGTVSVFSTVEGNGVRGKHGDGSMSLTLLHDAKEKGLKVAAATSLADPIALLEQVKSLGKQSDVAKPLNEKLVGGLSAGFTLAPGESRIVDFAVTWYFPDYTEIDALNVVNRTQDSRKLFRGKKRFYSTQFASAREVAVYLASDNKRLLQQTRIWNQTWYDSTLPVWLLDRTFIGLDCIATQTFHWFDDGRPYGWEGVDSCPGTCTHVWSYAQALGRIFPELERAFREKVDFKAGVGFEPQSGLVKDRGDYHAKGKEAVDGQAGSIMRVYREHQMSSDDAFLKRNWPNVKIATQFLIRKDGDDNGLLEGSQPHTLDAAWYGPMGWLSSVYLGALAAAEEMAIEVGDQDFAKQCRTILDRGYKNILAEVFDGEYFIHKPDPKKNGLNTNKGCHIDQVLGQSWAHQVGVGRILPKKETVSALHSIWTYNFAPDAGQYALDHVEIEASFRPYAMPGESGLLMTTWPKGGAIEAVPGSKLRSKENPKVFGGVGGYFNECMNGFEYQVASHMVFEGEPDSELVEKGLAVIRAVHDRYASPKRNPFNEIECGDHYARSMASYGVFLAACGYEYHGPKGMLGFAPRIHPSTFRAPFTTAEGWGTFSQFIGEKEMQAELAVSCGVVTLNTFKLNPMSLNVKTADVTLGGKKLNAKLVTNESGVSIEFKAPATIAAGQSLNIVLR